MLVFPPLRRVTPLPMTAFPFLAGMLVLATALVAGFLSGGDAATGGANGFVEALSGRSSTFLGDIGFLAPLGFAFVAGMVSAVNPHSGAGAVALRPQAGKHPGVRRHRLRAAEGIHRGEQGGPGIDPRA